LNRFLIKIGFEDGFQDRQCYYLHLLTPYGRNYHLKATAFSFSISPRRCTATFKKECTIADNPPFQGREHTH